MQTASLSKTRISEEKFKFYVDDLIDFVFPSELQHPLAAGRLFAFALCGPLDENRKIRTGAMGKRILADYELEQMCLQFEKEDIVQIYLHKSRDMGLLTNAEQEMMINQADGHLKQAKGKASLPKLTKQQVYEILEDLPRDEDGKVSFHEAQNCILSFREERIKQYKLVYPSLGKAKKQKDVGKNTKKTKPLQMHLLTGEKGADEWEEDEEEEPQETKTRKSVKRTARVSEATAPPTMFQKMKGLTNPDIIDQNRANLNKHAFKLSEIGATSDTHMTANVRLLREIPPYCNDPYRSGLKDGTAKRAGWNDTCTMKSTGLGSKVNATASSSTWKQKTTLY